MVDEKSLSQHVEETMDGEITKPDFLDPTKQAFDGSVGLLGPGEKVYLIPTPSPDPRDPLNLPLVRKWLLLMLVAIFSTVGLSMVSGLGGLLGTFIPIYIEEGRSVDDITHLMTLPTLFMGIGNLIGIPLALSIGRRPVFLGSCLILVLSTALCATQKNYEWHLSARCIMGLAAGQSEALAPLMVQETFFLHERALTQMCFTAFGNILTSILTLLTSYIGAAIGPGGWYALGSGLAGLVFVLSIFFVPETKYERPLSAYQGRSANVSHFTREISVDDENGVSATYTVHRIGTTDVRELDLTNYKPRTLASDMRLFVNRPDWQEGWRTCTRMFTVMLFPDVFWAFLLNGLTLGVNIAMGTTYGPILSAPPYSWSDKWVSVAMAGQIVVSFIALPTLGKGSDWLVAVLARRNGGKHQPQYRLVPLIFPTIVGVLSAILYGQAAAHPEKIHWFGLVFALNAFYFAFVGANQCGIVYCLDAYPTRSGPTLVAICAMRGILSFGTSYGVTPFIELRGYDGAFLIYGLLTAALGGLGIVVFLTSGKIRAFCSRFAIQTSDKNPTYS